MAKKTSKKQVIRKAGEPTPAKSTGFLPAGPDILPLIFCVLYFTVEFIPAFGGNDFNGSQWLYLVILDFAAVIYILDKKRDFDIPAASLFKNTFSRLYLALFILAGISVFFSLNPTEGWVCYARFIATIIAYANITIMLYGRAHLFKVLAQILAGILLIQCLQSLYLFFTEMNNYRLTDLILAMKGKAGNKNIFAASLVVKIPFALYGIYTSRTAGKIVNGSIFLLAALTILLANARTAYLALILELIIFLFICLQSFIKGRNRQQNIYNLSYIFIALAAAYFISLIALSSAKTSFLDDSPDAGQYGTVTERLASITSSADESREQRLFLWRNAVDYTKAHPFMGCGYGNWKIASIPYIPYLLNDLVVPIHAHNDFLEYFAELGIAGGLLYISLFVCILIYTLKTWRANTDENIRLTALFSLIALAGFAVDAFFNFPIERPVNQVLFVFIAAVNIISFHAKKDAEDAAVPPKPITGFGKSVFALAAMLLLLPAAYISFLNYQSSVVQSRVLPDLNNDPPGIPLNEMMTAFPSIPNLAYTLQPIDAIIGLYLFENKKYAEAITYLDRGAKANPYILYSDLIKANVYYAENRMDSAFYYAAKCYFAKPRAQSYYQTLIAVCARTGDTATLTKAFHLFIKYRPKESFGWNQFLMGMLNAKRKGDPELLSLADSALHLFPNDKNLLIRRNEISGNMGR